MTIATFLIVSLRKVIAEVTNVSSATTRAYQIQEADSGIMAMLKIACSFSADETRIHKVIRPTVPKPKGR